MFAVKSYSPKGNSKVSLFILISYVIAYWFSPIFISSLNAYAKTVTTPDIRSNINKNPEDALIQFTSGNHIIGFKEDKVYVASMDHALTVEFVGANKVTPQANSGKTTEGRAAALGKASYDNLWDGITLSYESGQKGLLESTYHLKAGADPDLIRLKYNVPLSIDDNGNLVLKYKTGTMQESAPIAWQEIEGKKVPVEISFKVSGEREAGFKVAKHDARYPLIIDPALTWNTFLGGAGIDASYGMAVDTSGNVYVTGYSSATWGSPVTTYTSGNDAFAAKLNSSGVLQWNTFLGGAGNDYGRGIAVDISGNVYVTGYSSATWGAPLTAYGGGAYDAFAAKLNSSGVLQWNTFLGGAGTDQGYGIAVDTSGNVYVTGNSDATWGVSVRAYTSGNDAFAAKLNSSGVLQWNTFLGGAGDDLGYGMAVDTSGNVYVAGSSSATWGSPVTAYGGGAYDAFAAKLNSSGVLQWNTFLGGAGTDYGFSIAVDTSGNVYVTGRSNATWGSPVTTYGGGYDAFAAKLNSSGGLQWNTFLGGAGDDLGYGIAVDTSGNVYVTGYSTATWGSPVTAFGGVQDAFAAKLNSSGVLQWDTFLGGAGTDYGYGIAVDTSGNVYVAGYSTATWGSPVRAYTAGNDAFIAMIHNDALSIRNDNVTYTLPYLTTAADKPVYCLITNQTNDNATIHFTVNANSSGTANQTFQNYNALSNYAIIYARQTRMLSFEGLNINLDGLVMGSVSVIMTSGSYGGRISLWQMGTIGGSGSANSWSCTDLPMACFQGTTTPKRNLVGYMCSDQYSPQTPIQHFTY
ncbi:MAG: SBBP repeat-containing protein [Nitrospirae bacterium]|nr:SBBP repeat-containing protein [Nitrospirota bacterium]